MVGSGAAASGRAAGAAGAAAVGVALVLVEVQLPVAAVGRRRGRVFRVDGVVGIVSSLETGGSSMTGFDGGFEPLLTRASGAVDGASGYSNAP